MLMSVQKNNISNKFEQKLYREMFQQKRSLDLSLPTDSA